MTQIKLHNTRTRKKGPFEPLDPDNVRMYVCGPTVYDRAHLGNARAAVVFDVLFRLLRQVYGADHVTYVRNFTDVDDKINARAAEKDRPIGEITAETTQWYLDDMAALGVMEPTHMPRATEYIGEKQPDGSYNHMIGMIETLIAEGYAYRAREPSNDPPKEYVLADREKMMADHALFEVDKFDRYGELSGRTVGDMIAGSRVEIAPFKKNPMDFVLWKPSEGEQPGWESPWGWGRPGWHIECSAMSKALLGDTFDIHGGGADLMFPHHENEIAQSCCANHTDQMARFWLHNEMLQVEGKKMSKSLGNFFTVRDLLDQGVPGEVIRFVMLSTHYRKPMDWTAEKVREAQNTLDRWMEWTIDLEPTPINEFNPSHNLIDALVDDLNTHLALTFLRALQSNLQSLLDHARWLGFLSDETRAAYREKRKHIGTTSGSGSGELEAALGMRLDDMHKRAKETKNFAEVDRFKAALSEAGVEVRISKEGVKLVRGPDFDAAKLEALK